MALALPPWVPLQEPSGQHFSLILFPSHSTTYFFFFFWLRFFPCSLPPPGFPLAAPTSQQPTRRGPTSFALLVTRILLILPQLPPPILAAELSIPLPSGFPPGPQSFSSPLRTLYPQHLFLLGSCGLSHQFLLILQKDSVTPTPRDQRSLSWMLTM